MSPTPDGPVDARIQRTQRSLRDAALSLAEATPIEAVSVADLARAAGINRATFYKHAESPLQILREALVDDLDQMRANFLPGAVDANTDPEALWRQAAADTAAHVERFRPIYERGFAPDASGALQTLLSRHIAGSMERMLHARPSMMPAHAAHDTELLVAAYASFLGHGLMAILQVWFASGSRDVGLYADAVIGALPYWMLHP